MRIAVEEIVLSFKRFYFQISVDFEVDPGREKTGLPKYLHAFNHNNMGD